MLIEQINRCFDKESQRPAVTFNENRYTYQSMREAVERLRGSLSDRGIGKGDRVAVILPNSPHFVLTHLAVLGMGAVSVPINIFHKSREIEQQLEDAEAKAVVAWSNFSDETEKALSHSESVKVRIYLGDRIPEGAENLVDLIAAGNRLPAVDSIESEDLALILYTAGTSGQLRGVELTHGNVGYQTRELGRVLRISKTDRFLGVLPFSGVMGLTMTVHLALAHGAELITQSRFHPGDALRSLEHDRITVFVGNPSMYSLMNSFPSIEKCELKEIRFFISCEARLPLVTAEGIHEKLGSEIIEGYGSTETCGIVTLNLFPGLRKPGSVGQSVSDAEISIRNDDLTETLPGEPGLIAVRGPSVARAYRNRPDRTHQVMRDGWFFSDDLGYLDDESNLIITGHRNDLIVKGGFPIYPREVEEVIEGLPHVREVGAVGIPDPVYGEEVKVCVVLKEGATIGPSEIIEYVKERIALYKCPKLVKFYKELPRTLDGRIIRNKLRNDESPQ